MKNGMLILSFLLMLCAVSAVDFTLNATYSISNVDSPTSVHVDDDYIYVIGDSDNRVYEFYIEDGSLRLERKIGEDDSSYDGYMRPSRDLWVDDDNVYVIDKSDEFFKFGKDGEFKAHATSESYKPDTGIAIAAKGNYVYLVDKENNRINIAYEYSENKYILNESISYTYLGIGDAIFAEPRDIYVRGDKIYIADTGKNRVAVFTASLDYVMSYGRGKGGTRFDSPYIIALDNEYLYVVESGLKSIKVVRLDTGATSLEINQSYYEFGRIKGVFAKDDLLYVIDNRNDTLILFNIDRTSRLTRAEVEPMFDSFNKSVSELCNLYAVSDMLNLSVQNKCAQYSADAHNASDLIQSENYDLAYDLIQEKLPSVEGDLAYMAPLIRDELADYYGEMYERAVSLGGDYAGALNITYTEILNDLEEVNYSISNEEYDLVVPKLKEISVKLDLFEQSLSSEGENIENLKDRYRSQLSSLAEEYSEIRNDLALYPAGVNISEIDLLMQEIEQDINNEDFSGAYDKLTSLSAKLHAAEKKLDDAVQQVREANKTISDARQRLDELSNKSLIVIHPNTTYSESLLADAESNLMTNPSLAKSLAEQAMDEIAAELKDYEDAKFLLIAGIAASVFLLFIGGIIAIGVLILLKKFKS